jgi:hypothetical protein
VNVSQERPEAVPAEAHEEILDEWCKKRLRRQAGGTFPNCKRDCRNLGTKSRPFGRSPLQAHSSQIWISAAFPFGLAIPDGNVPRA